MADGNPPRPPRDIRRRRRGAGARSFVAVALEDGTWHHERSYAPERAHRPETIELWNKISTVEDPEWTRRYHSTDGGEKAFGARAEVTLASGEVITDELAIADAHPLGARPFERKQYISKFTELAEGVVTTAPANVTLAVTDTVSTAISFPNAELPPTVRFPAASTLPRAVPS